MSKKKEYQCLAVYLYYNEPWESFLSEAVLPYIQTTLKTGIANHFFFIRYWDRGPHIRLRFFGVKDLLEDILKPNLREHFQNYFDSKPSLRNDPDYLLEIAEEHRWLPNNTLQFEKYEAELQRYGGKIGLQIAEQQFYASSKVVLDQLASKGKDWTYEDALGTAIKLHLSFVHSLGMDATEACSFFHFFFHNWLPRSIPHLSGEDLATQAKEAMASNLDAFEEAFKSQKNSLIPFHQQLWEALEEGASFEEESMDQWLLDTRSIKTKLMAAQEKGFLEKRPLAQRYSFWPESIAQSQEQQELWMLYADFMHLTNNRLGVLNKDEGYLSYLILKSLESFAA